MHSTIFHFHMNSQRYIQDKCVNEPKKSSQLNILIIIFILPHYVTIFGNLVILGENINTLGFTFFQGCQMSIFLVETCVLFPRTIGSERERTRKHVYMNTFLGRYPFIYACPYQNLCSKGE